MKVKQNDGTLKDFDKNRIIKSIIEETNLTEEEAIDIADCTEQYLNSFKLQIIESGFIRTLAYQILIEKGHVGKKINLYAPLYIPVIDLNNIDKHNSEATKDNANIGQNPESIHKKKADFISKQQNLRMFPKYIESAHRSGDIHIHDLEYFRTRNFCLPGNNKVVIKRNEFTEILSLEDLYKSFNNSIQKDGFELSTSNEDIYIQGVNKFVKITKMSKRHIKENIIKIKTRTGRQISLTKEHKLLDNNKLKQANEIVQGNKKTGSVLSKSKYIFEEYKNNFIDLSLYLDNTWKIYDNEICARETNRSIPRYLKLDKKLGFFFGLFLGDGHLSNGKLVEFTKKDPEMREIYILLVEELFGLKAREALRDNAPQVTIDSVTLCKLLQNILNVGVGAKNKNIPDLLFNKNKEFNIGLLDGLFCTDGFFRKTNIGGMQSIYTTTSEKLSLQILHMLESMGINCTIERKKLQKNRNNSIFQICILGKNENKKLKELGVNVTYTARKQIFDSFDLNGNIQPPNRLVVDLKEEEYYEGFVYDLTVESEDHLFCNADGIIISNCNDYDLRHTFYHGISIDGRGDTSATCSPAIHPNVAILHAVKVLGAGQVNSAGGQGFYNFLTFLSPYFKDLSEQEIEQQLQMFIYECNTMLIARGGQSQGYNSKLILLENNNIKIEKIGDFCSRYLKINGHKRINDNIKTLSLNKETGKLEWKEVTDVFAHIPASPILRTELKTGNYVDTTSDHSLFTLDKKANIIEVKPSDIPNTILVTNKYPIENKEYDRRLKYQQLELIKNKRPMLAKKLENILPIEVKSIKEIEYNYPYVYDIGVKDNENFVLHDGIVAHNSVFSSVQLTPGVPELWKDKPVVWKGIIEPSLVYGDLEDTVKKMFKIFMKIMIEGDSSGRPFSFPKPEVNIREEFLKNEYKESYNLAFELSLKYGSTYYDNECTPKRNKVQGISCFQCQKGDTTTLIKNEFGKITYTTMEQLFDNYAVEQQDGWNTISKHVQINTRDSWVPIKKLYKVKDNKSIKIKTSHGVELETTFDHPYLTQNSIILAKDLKLNDKLKIVDNIELTKTFDISPDLAWFFGCWAKCDCFSTSKIGKLNKKIIQKIFNAPKESIVAYLNGLLNFDKIKNNNSYPRTMQFISSSKTLINQIQYLCKMVGYNAEISKDEKSIYKIIVTNKTLHDRYCEILKIEEKEYISPINFYDLEVEDDSHEFMAGNLLVTHNCCAYNFSIDPTKDSEFDNKMNFRTKVGFSMGAAQVISINLPRLALKSSNYNELEEKTEKLIREIVMPVFRAKDDVRNQIYTPFFGWPAEKQGIFNSDNLSYVIGIIGINEVCEIIENKNITESKNIIEFIKWLNLLVETISMEEQSDGRSKIALSRTPAETTAMRLAKLDLSKYGKTIEPYIKGDIETGAIYYTNGCMIPPEYEEDLLQKIKIEGEFFKYISGGNILHLFLGEAQPSIGGFAELMYNIFTKTDIDYFAVSRDLTICKKCKNIIYEIKDCCTHCNSKDIIRLARITGYMQSVEMWNEGKIDELKRRKRY